MNYRRHLAVCGLTGAGGSHRKSKAKGEAGSKAAADEGDDGDGAGSGAKAGRKRAPRKAGGAKRKTEEEAEQDDVDTGASACRCTPQTSAWLRMSSLQRCHTFSPLCFDALSAVRLPAPGCFRGLWVGQEAL